MELTIAEVLNELSEDFKYSRVPVYDEQIDNIKGIVYLKDILLSSKNKNTKMKSLVREAYFVPETKPINDLFSELRKNRKQIAIAIDEYGGTSGIVTMEDILEEIVGEIYDEYDEIEKIEEKVDENTYLFSGNIAIYEIEDILDVDIEDGDYDTISGYLVEKLGRIPTDKDKGTVIETEDVVYKIENVKERRITKIKACKIEKVEQEEKEEDKEEE